MEEDPVLHVLYQCKVVSGRVAAADLNRRPCVRLSAGAVGQDRGAGGIPGTDRKVSIVIIGGSTARRRGGRASHLQPGNVRHVMFVQGDRLLVHSRKQGDRLAGQGGPLDGLADGRCLGGYQYRRPVNVAIIRRPTVQIPTKRRDLAIPLAQVQPNVRLVADGHGCLGRQREGVDLDGREALEDEGGDAVAGMQRGQAEGAAAADAGRALRSRGGCP